MQLEQATQIATRLVYLLRPSCHQIQIGGSIRRCKPMPKDIEIVYIPREEPRVIDLMGTTESYSLTDDTLVDLIKDRILKRDTHVKRWGPKYKRLIHVASKQVVELFAATPDNWGLILALRTGPGDFNKLMVTSSCRGGAMPLGFTMRDGYLWHWGERCFTPTEESFFATIHRPCWPPEQRTLQRLQHHLQEA
jgi:DNA polymerase/3'-5' exonuclease PolX